MKLTVSPQVIDDLGEIKKYISDKLCNPAAAKRIVNKIRLSYKALKDNPYIGTALNAIIDIENDYRFRVCGNYLIFYKVIDNEIIVERVIYGRRDYSQLLLGSCLNDDENDNNDE